MTRVVIYRHKSYLFHNQLFRHKSLLIFPNDSEVCFLLMIIPDVETNCSHGTVVAGTEIFVISMCLPRLREDRHVYQHRIQICNSKQSDLLAIVVLIFRICGELVQTFSRP